MTRGRDGRRRCERCGRRHLGSVRCGAPRDDSRRRVDAAAELVRLLEPWADRHVILNCYGGGGADWGPVAHHHGRLALLRHDRCRGEELLRRAVELSECARAPRFAARSRAELARLG